VQGKIMNESNEFFRVTVIAHQTFKRLLVAGVSDAEARRLLVDIINTEESAMKRHNRPFDESGITQQLRSLTAQNDGY
jgi:hypothetical protein